jgi:tryptophan-rich sensory protein
MATHSARRTILGLLAWLGVTFLAASLGAFASAGAGAFYQALLRPAWAPPASLFAPVWSLLYLLMGLAAWLAWRERGLGASLGLFLIQLALNALWTWIFFRWHLGLLAFAEIALLWGLILGTVIVFWRIRPLAGALLLPYWAWVTFAAALTWAVWRRNPHLLG